VAVLRSVGTVLCKHFEGFMQADFVQRNNFRKQYAGIGYTYDADADVFVAPQPFPSWTLDDNNDWQPPTPNAVEEANCYAWFEAEPRVDRTRLMWAGI
jgi:hypothetical protein